MKQKSKTRDMTTGEIWKHIILFSIPLLIGNFFQQLYNTVDSIVVGNYVSKQALAAVGSTGPVINTLVGFFMGMATGAGVLISHYFGAKNEKELHKAIHTTIMLTFVLSIVFTAVGICMVPFMVNFMKTPSDVVQESTTYLRIYFAGMPALMIYNMGSGILRAVGDSRRPLYFLCISSVVNIIFDLVFVIGFSMGIEGVAFATVISEIVSAIMVLTVLTTSKESYRLIWKDLSISGDVMIKICKIGIPAGLQMAVTSFSNVFVQSYINNFGSACMAGWSSYSKVDQFVILPMQSLSLAATTFVGQNIGAKNVKRANKGMRTALYMSIVVTVILSIGINVFANPLIMLFTKDNEVLAFGKIFLHFMSPFYVCCCFNQIHAGALRGRGNANAPMVIMLGSFVVFRQIYLAITKLLFHSIYPVAFAYPAGWILCSIIMFFYFKKVEKNE